MKRKRPYKNATAPLIERILRKAPTLEPVCTGSDDVLAARDFTNSPYELYLGRPTLYSHPALLDYMLATRQNCRDGRRTFVDADGHILAIDWKPGQTTRHTIWYFDDLDAHLLETRSTEETT